MKSKDLKFKGLESQHKVERPRPKYQKTRKSKGPETTRSHTIIYIKPTPLNMHFRLRSKKVEECRNEHQHCAHDVKHGHGLVYHENYPRRSRVPVCFTRSKLTHEHSLPPAVII